MDPVKLGELPKEQVTQLKEIKAQLKELKLGRSVARKRTREEQVAELNKLKAELKNLKAERSLPGAKVSDESKELRIATAPLVREALQKLEAARREACNKKLEPFIFRPNSQGDPCCAAAPSPGSAWALGGAGELALPPSGRPISSSQTSDRRGGSSASGARKDEYNWRYHADEEDVLPASTTLETHRIRPQISEFANILEASRGQHPSNHKWTGMWH